jgi:L-alanine-DL-glutamate epimerase-like enolase superfamily enzyme
VKISFSLELISLPLRYEWKLSRNTSLFKVNGIVTARYADKEGKGEIAPNIRYDETPDRVQAEFDASNSFLEQEITESNWPEILAVLSVCSALRTGIDMAFQNLMASIKGIPLHTQLDIQTAESRSICYTIPVMAPSDIAGFMEKENLFRFSWLKIKVHRDSALAMVEEVCRLYSGPVAIDGNESWTDVEAALEFAKAIPSAKILFLEQPMPAAQRDDYILLNKISPVPIWGDESILSKAEPEYWKQAFSGINVKLMKAGSLPNAIHLLKTARSIGLQTMVGCMVETSLGISAALSLESLADYMDLDGFILLEHEPFGLVNETDGIVRFTL